MSSNGGGGDEKIINPHNPEFITKVPWYLGGNNTSTASASLQHHNIQKNDHFLTLSETDQLINNKINNQINIKNKNNQHGYRKGACKNCGAITHDEKSCVERPRSIKKAAWKTGQDIASDEVVLRLEDHGKVSYSTKRDSWQGYDPDSYKDTINKYDRLEEERKRVRQEENEKKRLEEMKKLEQEGNEDDGNITSKKSKDNNNKNDDDDSSSDSDYDDSDDDNDDKEFIANDEDAKVFNQRSARQGGVGGAQMKNTARNLRIREDIPKYLRNLALDSAFYDPKSRSMRLNPLPNENPEDLPFAGDNFLRYSGDALKLAQEQVLCWEMQARGENIDVLSNPSAAELMHKQIVEKKTVLAESKKKEILDKYGGQEHAALDPRLRLGQTEAYVEYTVDGRPINKDKKGIARTKYDEDIYIGNHTSVWGSYFNRSKRTWGYACCHQCFKNAYCLGEAGKKGDEPIYTGIKTTSQPLTGTNDSSNSKNDKKSTDDNDKKRKGAPLSHKNEFANDDEMESYMKSKMHRNDPMANYLNDQN